MPKSKPTIQSEEEHEQDFYTLLAATAEEDKERLVMSIIAQVKAGDSGALKILEKALLQRQNNGSGDGRPIVYMPIEMMDREGIVYEIPDAPEEVTPETKGEIKI